MILPAIPLILLLLAQNAGPQPSVAPASIEGIAVRAGTGESLSRVTVIAVPSGPPSSRQSMTTGPDGEFLLENLRPGSYQLTANCPGYAPVEFGQRGPNGRGTNFTLKAGQKMQNVALTLIPEGSITGHIVDANGEPFRRALVQAHKVIYQEAGRSLQTIQAVPSDDRGEFRLFWLPPGKY